MEDWYTSTVHDLADVGATSDKKLIAAADTVCDNLDSGTSFKIAYVMTATDYADDADDDAPISAALAATSSICPEHKPIADAWIAETKS